MTENPTTPTDSMPVGEPDDLEAADDDAAAEDTSRTDQDYITQLRGEAKRHRLRATAAETKLKVAEATSHMLMKREIERIAATKLVEKESIWSDDTNQADLLDPDLGLPDEGRIHARCAELVDKHRHWALPQRLTPAASTVTSDNYPGKAGGPQPQTMADLLKEATGG